MNILLTGGAGYIGSHTIIELDKKGHYERMVQHLREKYGRGGYLHLWFEHSPNAERLETLRQIIDDENLLKQKFEEYYGM